MGTMPRGDFEKVGIHMEAMARADVKTEFGVELGLIIIITIVTGLESHTRCASRAHVVRMYVP
jgi:hypothetical protein